MKLNGTEIPKPKQDITVEPQEISVAERTASGRLVKDITGSKDIITLTYDGLLPDDAQTFINLYRAGNPVTFEYENFEGPQEKEVYINSLPHSIYSPRVIYTKDITITLEEV